MTDQIKRKFPRIDIPTSAFFTHLSESIFHGSLTLTSMQPRSNDDGFAEKFNITSYAHILTHFLGDKINSTKALTNWQFDKKTAQVLNFYFIIIKIALL